MHIIKCSSCNHIYNIDKYKLCPICNNCNIWSQYSIDTTLKESDKVTTYIAKDKLTDEKFIIKKICNNNVYNNIKQTLEYREKLKHQNILSFHDAVFDKNIVYLIYKYITGINLNTFMECSVVTYTDFYSITKSILDAIEYLSKNNIVHGDIKPSNIIYNQKYKKAVLVDFDYLIFKDKIDFKYIGTIEFSSPEQISKNEYTTESDIFSLGLTLYNLIEKRLPFALNEEGIKSKVSGNYEVEFNNALAFDNNDNIKKIIKGMLKYQAKDRLKYNEINELLEEKMDRINTSISEEYFDDLVIKGSPNTNYNYDISKSVMLSISNFDFYENFGNNREKHITNSFFRDIGVSEEKSLLEGKHFAQKTTEYHELLLSEYSSLIVKSNIIFWLWVSSLMFAFVILIIGIVLLILNKDIEALFTVLLEGFVYGIYKLFEINNKHYQNLIERKLKHLEKIDKYEFLFSKVSYLSDEQDRNKKVNDIIDSIRKDDF